MEPKNPNGIKILKLKILPKLHKIMGKVGTTHNENFHSVIHSMNNKSKCDVDAFPLYCYLAALYNILGNEKTMLMIEEDFNIKLPKKIMKKMISKEKKKNKQTIVLQDKYYNLKKKKKT